MLVASKLCRERGGRITEINSGITFKLPREAGAKTLSVIDIGPFGEQRLAEGINRFFGVNVLDMSRIDTYLLVHEPITDHQKLELLTTGKPFVDPIITQAALNRSLVEQHRLHFDYLLLSMLRPGTSDAQGSVALEQALRRIGMSRKPDDVGFYARKFLIRSDDIGQNKLDAIAAFLANPELCTNHIFRRHEYDQSRSLFVPVVSMQPNSTVEEFGVAAMSDEDLLKLNNERKLAGSLDELRAFAALYKDSAFLEERAKHDLSNKATDVEIETWFGLRSEHCFHKEFNAQITLEDTVNDPLFAQAHAKGWLKKESTDSHARYTLEEGIFKTFIEQPARTIEAKLKARGNNWIISMFDDNSGVVHYDDKFMFSIKFETHNSPSQKEPVQGAKTGINGVVRDTMGTARGTFDPIANFFLYCTGDPSYHGWLPPGVKHPYVTLKGITQGTREGGNELQIPTLGGGLITDPRYIAKCLVYVGNVGWSPITSPIGESYTGKSPKLGDLVFIAGQAVGIDGVHGATESSLSAGAHISLGHVQADFSFIQAKLRDYILDVARSLLFSGITDMGAMGVGSSSHEIARATGGLFLDLALHPKKYQGIAPWQINCSETQDRMLLTAKKENKDELLRRAHLHGVDVTELGTLTDSGYVHLVYEGKTVALLDINKLFDKNPRKQMNALWDTTSDSKPLDLTDLTKKYTIEKALALILSQPDVASKEWFFRQKDSSVKGGTILNPLLGRAQEVEADATLQKPLDTEIREGKDWGALAYAHGICPKLADVDPYLAAQRSFIDMVGKIIAIGGTIPDMNTPKWDAWAVCGNYCQPNSDAKTTLTPESGMRNLASLVREGIGVREVVEKLNIPVISGKDSMKCSAQYRVDALFTLDDLPADLRAHANLVQKPNGEHWIELHDPPTYLASCAVKIEDYRKCVTTAFKQDGDIIYIIGTTKNNLAASQLAHALGYNEGGKPLKGGAAPVADLDEFISVAQGIHGAIDTELVASCSYIHNGGMLTALTKAALAGETGAEIDTQKMNGHGCTNDYEILFSETPGRFIVTIDPKDKERFESGMASIPYQEIGKVKKAEDASHLTAHLTITRAGEKTEAIHLQTMKEQYQKPLRFGLPMETGA